MNENLGNNEIEFDNASKEALLELLTILDSAPKMANFSITPAYVGSEHNIASLLVAAAHEGYLMGLAHGSSTPRETLDVCHDVSKYVAMTHAAVAAVNEFQATHPVGLI